EKTAGPEFESYGAAMEKVKAYMKKKAAIMVLMCRLQTLQSTRMKIETNFINQDVSGQVLTKAPKIEQKASGKVFMDTAVFKAVATSMLNGKLKQRSGKASLAGGTLSCDE